jgi:hypothetical protein
MRDVEAVSLFAVAIVFALANLPLLFVPPGRSEQRLWRTLGVQHLRRWITRRRNPGHRHRDGETALIARTNIWWHAGLGVVLASLIFHPWLRSGPPRIARYFLLAGCVAYFIGSIVQRQKLVVSIRRRRVLTRVVR